jgi:hypothetical protein
VLLRVHLQRALKQGRQPPELIGPPCPPELAWLWGAFQQLSLGRQAGFAGAQPLSWLEMAAWMRLTRTPLSAADINAMRALDLAYLSVIAAVAQTPHEPKKAEHG